MLPLHWSPLSDLDKPGEFRLEGQLELEPPVYSVAANVAHLTDYL